MGSITVGVGSKRVKVAQIADQLDDTELELIEKKEVDEAYRTFRELTGSDPPSDSEPTPEQLTIMNRNSSRQRVISCRKMEHLSKQSCRVHLHIRRGTPAGRSIG